jgi:hypothetical protein
MKTPIALFVWALSVLLLATSAGARAASEERHVLGPYHSEALARAAAQRLGHHGWNTHVSGRRSWYVHVKWTDTAEEGAVQTGVSVSAGQSRGKDCEHEVQAPVRGTKQEFILEADAVSDLRDGDWQINATRVHLWAKASAGSPRLKRHTGRNRVTRCGAR